MEFSAKNSPTLIITLHVVIANILYQGFCFCYNMPVKVQG